MCAEQLRATICLLSVYCRMNASSLTTQAKLNFSHENLFRAFLMTITSVNLLSMQIEIKMT